MAQRTGKNIQKELGVPSFDLVRQRAHPCPRRIQHVMWLVKWFSESSIIDPFMGTGTTMRAAKDLGRKAIGIEIEEKYCEIAARRLQQEVLAL